MRRTRRPAASPSTEPHPPRRASAQRRFALSVGLAACVSAGPACKGGGSTGDGAKVEQTVLAADEVALLDDGQQKRLGEHMAAVLRGTTLPDTSSVPTRISNGDVVVHVMLRTKGAELAAGWAKADTLAEAAAKAVTSAKETAGDEAGKADLIEVNLGYAFADVPTDDSGGDSLTHRRRGIRGIEFKLGDEITLVTPTRMLAYNTAFEDEFERYRKDHGLDKKAWQDQVVMRRWESQQMLVRLEDPVRVQPMERGNTYVPPEAVTQANVQKLADLMGDWMFKHMREDGRETYRWLPGSSSEDPDNNMIRQWMATVAMVRVARDRDDPELFAKCEKNIAYNLEHFYKQDEDGKGHIEFHGRATLGEQALAVIAIMLHPSRERFAREEAGLRKTVDELWDPADGSFHVTYLPKPSKGGAGNNFYPGETLLMWSETYLEKPDPELLARFMKSFEYYREWHLEKKNRIPPFVPWHTQAYYNVWTVTKDPELEKFVYRMNDWLIDNMQMWGDKGQSYRDEAGQFYNPSKSAWGSANSSSTGVYIEGLIDAWAMAKEAGDKERQERYRKSLARALRSTMQIQYVDEIDTFYVTDPEMAIGGIRTSAHRGDIRVDNTQHNLMGILKLLRRFDASEYGTD